MTAGPERDGALTGVHILDLSRALGGAFCTATLERMGAEVVRLDVPAATGAFLDAYLTDSDVYRQHLGRDAERRVIDLSEPSDLEAFRELVAWSDAVVEDSSEPLLDLAGIDVADAPGPRGMPIVVSLTPYGRGGPRRGDLACDLILFHGAGPGLAVPGLVADPATNPPLRLGSHQGSFVGGLVAAINLCAALHARRRADVGARVTADVSCHEALANSFRQSLGTYAYYGGGTGRDLAYGRGAGGTVDHRNIPCKDGYVNIAWGGVQQWDSLKGLLGNPEWAEDPDLATPTLRFRNWMKIVPRLQEWAAEFDKEHLLYLCQGWRIPSAPVNDGAELLAADVLTARGFWTRTMSASGDEVLMPGSPTRRVYPTPTPTTRP